MKIQEKIRSMRKSKNWLQVKMATQLNIFVNRDSKIEHSETNPYLSKLEQKEML